MFQYILEIEWRRSGRNIVNSKKKNITNRYRGSMVSGRYLNNKNVNEYENKKVIKDIYR